MWHVRALTIRLKCKYTKCCIPSQRNFCLKRQAIKAISPIFYLPWMTTNKNRHNAVTVKSNLTGLHGKEKVAQLAVLTWLFQG